MRHLTASRLVRLHSLSPQCFSLCLLFCGRFPSSSFLRLRISMRSLSATVQRISQVKLGMAWRPKRKGVQQRFCNKHANSEGLVLLSQRLVLGRKPVILQGHDGGRGCPDWGYQSKGRRVPTRFLKYCDDPRLSLVVLPLSPICVYLRTNVEQPACTNFRASS